MEKYFKKYIKKDNKYFKYKKYVLKTFLKPKPSLHGVARFLIVFLSIIY